MPSVQQDVCDEGGKSLLDLPNELLLAIGQQLENTRDINSLVQTCVVFNRLFSDYLYEDNVKNGGSSALFWAAARGFQGTVQKFLDMGADVDLPFLSPPASTHHRRRTPLSFAAEEGHETMVSLLLNHGANVNSESLFGWPPLLWAVRSGQTAVVKILLEKGAKSDFKGTANPELWTTTSVTPLYLAAEKGWEGIVKLLLESGCDPNVQQLDYAPLFAASNGKHEAVVRLLVDRGANVNHKEPSSRILLSRVACAGDGMKSVVNLLLDLGADPNLQDGFGKTPLFDALYPSSAQIVRILLDRGADPNARDLRGSTPLLCAMTRPLNVRNIELLLERGADPYAQDRSGTSPLSLAPSRGMTDLLAASMERSST